VTAARQMKIQRRPDSSPLPLGERGQGVRGAAPIGTNESLSADQRLHPHGKEDLQKFEFAIGRELYARLRVKPLIPCPFSPKGRRGLVVPYVERAQQQ